MKRFFEILFLVSALCLLINNTEVSANDRNEKFDELFNRDAPQTFEFKYVYNELYEFLNITEEEYKSKWENGKTIIDIAKEQDIPFQQLILYLAEKQFQALDEALKVGSIDRYFYYDYAISYMKGDIIEFINRNPNKKETGVNDF